MTTPEEERAHWDQRASMAEMWAEPDDGVDHCMGHLFGPLTAMVSGSTLLELGCGIGRLTRPVARALPLSTIIGMDISPTAINLARQDTTEPNVEYQLADGRGISQVLLGVDGGWSVVTLQHIPQEAQLDLLQTIQNILTPSGVFIAQVTVGGDDADWCHPLTEDQIHSLHPANVATDERFPTWRWLHLGHILKEAQ